MNLLIETINALDQYGLKGADVEYVTDNDNWCTWEEFAAVARTYDYDKGYGDTEVNESMKVVGADWWLERHEYDGSEWWEFKTYPAPGKCHAPQFDLRSNFERLWDDD